MGPAAVVMARAPRAGDCHHGLEPLLGAERCARLQAVLLRRAVAWARAVAGERVAVAFTPAGAGAEVAAEAGAGVEVWEDVAPQAAAERAFAVFGGPVLLARAEMPRLREGHARAALLDLDEGADVAFGPSHGGGWYLVALAAPHPELLEADTVAECLGVAGRLGLEVGLLRMERDLTSPEDAEALLVDPIVPLEVRTALRG